MRHVPLVPAAFVLCLAAPAFAQEWIEYTSRADLFTVNFPANPTVREITYNTEYGAVLPGRVHSYQDGPNRYAVTVIDYSNIQKLHAQRLANCDKYPNLCNNPWVGELRGAMDYAAGAFLKRDVKVTDYGYQQHRADRRTTDAARESRRQPDVRHDPHAREPALHPGGDRCGRFTAAGTLSAVARVRGQGRNPRPVRQPATRMRYPPPPRVQYQPQTAR